MAKYKLIEHEGKVTSIWKKEGVPANMRITIPPDPDNTDYQEYLEWVDEGNTAEAAD